MQVLVGTLIFLAIVVYIIYRIKKTFTKKEIYGFIGVVVVLIAGMLYYNNLEDNKLPDAFKAHYLNEKNIDIVKLSYNRTDLEMLSSSKEIYDFVYIIEKDTKQYVCEAKNVEAQRIEDEYVFKKYKEECRLK